MPLSAPQTSYPLSYAQGTRRRKFKSSRLIPGEYDEKPWLQDKIPKREWERVIFWAGIVLGFVIGGAICFLSWINVMSGEFCLMHEDDFSAGIDDSTWNFEIQRGGFGTGSFEWTTDDPKNIFTDAEGLHIVPTLTTESTNITLDQMYDKYVVNLTTDGTCTHPRLDIDSCSIRSNVTAGAIINPVRSARINTKGKKTIQYGKVEVVAKMPKGAWLWPAIWMMPDADVYGAWPRSGEIDIAESRGNYGDFYPDGRDSVISALHWGPLPEADAFYKTSGKHNVRRTDYTEGFHTFGLEWTEDYLFTYLDSRLLQVFFIKFNHGYKRMWDRGGFGEKKINKSALFDPWSATGRANTPFDQSFYLILNVAVGGTNGFFEDGVANKPWVDASINAPKEFFDARELWRHTWPDSTERGMTVRNVKMWRQGKC
ncbi:Glycosyl hydrolase [Lasiodiplodia theobromae]|uniref:Glycosyl hydrolase n=1 Tax=Lasiodiplodia theobromae TaxID=45133 RepID=UPI0015C3D8EE|nr:Glycosyl hydrolase [Lasiodiplodia theobromae]KAF4543854.1 Glycosyl hydrolase [Lasiodiplodia theobromae]